MTYREYIYKVITGTDLSDQEEVTELISWLANELLEKTSFLKKTDEKLMEVMSARAYKKWSIKCAKEMFNESIENLPEGEFKEFLKRNGDVITDDNLSFNERSEIINERESND